MRLKQTNELGRSMIEMLGVLAIVGMLSVGGIAGYSKAMMKYKLNKLTEEYIQFFNDILIYQKDFRQEQIRQGTRFFFASYLVNAKLVPDKWRTIGGVIFDSMGNQFTPFIAETHKRMVLDLKIKNADDAEGNAETCRTIMINVVQHYRDVIYSAGLYRGEGNAWGGHFLGTTTCGTQEGICLSDVTIAEIQNICSNCLEDSGCVLSINFTL
ncbi:MAG: hypothetical protein NC218_09935 [Acetobacter sp.]|nr:hypothetical protein [Acetobacter sp.]